MNINNFTEFQPAIRYLIHLTVYKFIDCYGNSYISAALYINDKFVKGYPYRYGSPSNLVSEVIAELGLENNHHARLEHGVYFNYTVEQTTLKRVKQVTTEG